MARLKMIPITFFALVQIAIGIASHNLGEGAGQVATAIALVVYAVALTLRIRWLALVLLVAPPIVGLATREIGLAYNLRATAVIFTTGAIAIALDIWERNNGTNGSDTALDVV